MGKAADLEGDYDQSTAGEVLFFKNKSGVLALRFELQDKGWEFSDGKYIGKGTLRFPRGHRPRS